MEVNPNKKAKSTDERRERFVVGWIVVMIRQIRYEQLSFWRNPLSAFFSFGFPLLFLFIFGTLNKGVKIVSLGNIPYDQYFIPGIVGIGIASSNYINMVALITNRKETGLLKRVWGTPCPSWVYLSSIIANSVLNALLIAFVTILVGRELFSLDGPYNYGSLFFSIIVGAFAFTALGLAVSTLLSNAQAALAVANGTYFPLTFISGTFFPVPKTSFLYRIAGFFPIRHLNGAIFAPFNPLPGAAHVAGFDLVIVGVWGLLAALYAIRQFKWV